MRLHELRRNRRKPLEIDDHLERVRDALLPLFSVVHLVRMHDPDHGHGVEPAVDVLHLPQPPHAVQGAVVEVEDRIPRGGGRVASRVDGVDVMA